MTQGMKATADDDDDVDDDDDGQYGQTRKDQHREDWQIPLILETHRAEANACRATIVLTTSGSSMRAATINLKDC